MTKLGKVYVTFYILRLCAALVFISHYPHDLPRRIDHILPHSNFNIVSIYLLSLSLFKKREAIG